MILHRKARLLIIILFVSCHFPTAHAQTSLDRKTLHFVHWDGSVFSWSREGVCCWVQDSSGNLRFEIMEIGRGGSSSSLQRILEWNGDQGWTVISVGDGGGTFSRWFEQWQTLSPVLDSWLRTFAGIMEQEVFEGALRLPADVKEISIDGRPLRLPVFSGSPTQPRVRRFQIPDFKSSESLAEMIESGFRQNSVRRGLGRGGAQTVLNVSGTVSGSPGLRIVSSRHPGSILLDEYRSFPADFSTDEVFLPWWPLSEVIKLKK